MRSERASLLEDAASANLWNQPIEDFEVRFDVEIVTEDGNGVQKVERTAGIFIHAKDRGHLLMVDRTPGVIGFIGGSNKQVAYYLIIGPKQSSAMVGQLHPVDEILDAERDGVAILTQPSLLYSLLGLVDPVRLSKSHESRLLPGLHDDGRRSLAVYLEEVVSLGSDGESPLFFSIDTANLLSYIAFSTKGAEESPGFTLGCTIQNRHSVDLENVPAPRRRRHSDQFPKEAVVFYIDHATGSSSRFRLSFRTPRGIREERRKRFDEMFSFDALCERYRPVEIFPSRDLPDLITAHRRSSLK